MGESTKTAREPVDMKRKQNDEFEADLYADHVSSNATLVVMAAPATGGKTLGVAVTVRVKVRGLA